MVTYIYFFIDVSLVRFTLWFHLEGFRKMIMVVITNMIVMFLLFDAVAVVNFFIAVQNHNDSESDSDNDRDCDKSDNDSDSEWQ